MPPRIRKRILAARTGRATAPPRQVPGRSDSAILSLLAGLMVAADKIIYATGGRAIYYAAMPLPSPPLDRKTHPGELEYDVPVLSFGPRMCTRCGIGARIGKKGRIARA
jgi:hypothetical protein